MNRELIETEVKLAAEKHQHKMMANGPGKRLHAARVAANLPIETVAMTLHLTTQMVSNLENDNYKIFAGHTFIRGYLRNYARLLNISPDEIIASFNNLNLAEHESDKPKLSLKTTYRRRNLALVKLSVIAGSIGGGLLLLMAVTVAFKYFKAMQPITVAHFAAPTYETTNVSLAMPEEKAPTDELTTPSAIIDGKRLLKHAQQANLPTASFSQAVEEDQE